MSTRGATVKPSISTKFFAAAALAVVALGAQARGEVYVSVGVQGAPVYTQPVPVYQPVYPSRHWRERDYHDRDDHDDDGRSHRRGRVYYDADGDGIPNGRDSFDNRVFHRHDVDGDGVPNWKDSRDNRSQPIWWREGYHPSRDEATPYRRHR